MDLSRRSFIAAATAAPAGAQALLGREYDQAANEALFTPDHGIDAYAGLAQTPIGEHLPLPDPTYHALSRSSFGVTRSNMERAQLIGVPAYLQEQLYPESIPNALCEQAIAQRYPASVLPRQQVLQWYSPSGGHGHGKAETDLVEMSLIRQTWSERQLYEVMVDFWSNHFNIYSRASGRIRVLKWLDDRDVIRRYAMTNFRTLLIASATSAAMLEYLDNAASKLGDFNENYARELLELHTLGLGDHYSPELHGGLQYGEDDVMAVARCFTGWTTSPNIQYDYDGDGQRETLGTSDFYFRPDWHDYGEKTVLDETFGGQGQQYRVDTGWLPAGPQHIQLSDDPGLQEGLAVIDMLLKHPSTARHIASKLVRRFVSDDVSAHAELVDDVAAAFRGPQLEMELDGQAGTPVLGDVRGMLQVIFNSPDFLEPQRSGNKKYQRPLEFFAASMRTTDAQLTADTQLRNDDGGLAPALNYRAYQLLARSDKLGQRPFDWPTPDGFPDVASHWLASGATLQRWLWASDLAGDKAGAVDIQLRKLHGDATTANALFDTLRIRLLGGRRLLPADTRAYRNYVVDRDPTGEPSSDDEARWNAELDHRQRDKKTRGLIAMMLASAYFQLR